jgi:hypothetical protein
VPFQQPISTDELHNNKDALFQISQINVTKTHASMLVSDPPMEVAII